MTTEVRAARPDDLDPIADLDASAFLLVPWSRQMVVEGVAGIVPGLTFLVATAADDGFLGYAAVSVVDDVAELQRIAVPVAARRTGVARILVEAVARHGRAAGAARVLLEVHEDNAPGQALYAATGFVEIARRRGYFRDGGTALVLQRDLRDDLGESTG